nr:60S ribosomal protein L24-like [Lolium perenne]
MVLKTELCRFSGIKIYPGRGIRFVRSDSQVFLFFNSKCKRYFHNRLKPANLSWTTMFRKQHTKVHALIPVLFNDIYLLVQLISLTILILCPASVLYLLFVSVCDAVNW